jgi:hypothetical protein
MHRWILKVGIWLGALLLLYVVGYAVARGSGMLIYFTQIVHCNGGGSRTYHIVRVRSFASVPPTDRDLGTVTLVDTLFSPIALVELRLRGIPEFESP